MELQTLSQISKFFHLSTRTLRYYEQIGLIQSEKKDVYAYRVYSEDTIKRLQQIVILRKLRIVSQSCPGMRLCFFQKSQYPILS